MSKEIAISVNSLSKTYKLYKTKYDFIKEAFHPLRKSYHNKFYALKDISFKAEKGEVIGIIGQNGSGKSTLLKILASVVTQTSGKYYCKGKVTALLELGGGFNRDLTGIQNIKFLGALQGYSKKEMPGLIQRILDFADIGEYAHQSVNTYSSGMYVRLAFSMNINIDPEILIIDEALAVGDIRFQQKCYRKIQEFKDEGKTIVICTHNLDAVKKFCTRAIWLHQGNIREEGNPYDVTDYYNAFMTSSESVLKKKVAANQNVKELPPIQIHGLPELYNEIKWNDLTKYDSFGIGKEYFRYASIIDIETGKNISTIKGGENVRVLLYIVKHPEFKSPAIHILLNGQFGSTVFKINSNFFEKKLELNTLMPNIVNIDFAFPKISNGSYTMSFGILSLKRNDKQYIHWVHDGLLIKVSNPNINYKLGTQLVIEKAVIQTRCIY